MLFWEWMVEGMVRDLPVEEQRRSGASVVDSLGYCYTTRTLIHLIRNEQQDR